VKIGIFDSGLGGKLILDAVRHHIPQYDYAYYGDTAHVPYGDRAEEEVYHLTTAGVKYLFDQENCKLVIIACNTSSSETVKRLQDEYVPSLYPDRKVLGVIVPTLEHVLATDCKNVLLLATRRTIESGKYQRELTKQTDVSLNFDSVPMPMLVPYIEARDTKKAVVAVRDVLKEKYAEGIKYDGIILGCTHYGLLADGLRSALEGGITVFSQTEIIPEKLRAYLQTHPELTEKLSLGKGSTEYLTGS